MGAAPDARAKGACGEAHQPARPQGNAGPKSQTTSRGGPPGARRWRTTAVASARAARKRGHEERGTGRHQPGAPRAPHPLPAEPPAGDPAAPPPSPASAQGHHGCTPASQSPCAARTIDEDRHHDLGGLLRLHLRGPRPAGIPTCDRVAAHVEDPRPAPDRAVAPAHGPPPPHGPPRPRRAAPGPRRPGRAQSLGHLPRPSRHCGTPLASGRTSRHPPPPRTATVADRATPTNPRSTGPPPARTNAAT